VAHNRRLDKAGRVDWVDIDRDPAALAAQGVDTAAAMRRLHALDEHGQLVSGVPAFLAVWRQLPSYRSLARVVERLRLTALLQWAYTRFADWRFERRYGTSACQMRR
jgi:predicted DCC family thiol-disulfide oxidoreductase YuxK